ncbi:aminopeptidase N C-terminal domain-containing protein, partial [Bordetella trematum]|uniref:aminopeptidase N C-terminal domain-containing protein n=1 Tax=Bordetella trematum TaxID=123899 RepID=UPI003D0DDE0D
ELAASWQAAFAGNQVSGAYSPAPGPAGQRALKNLALAYLMAGGVEGAQALAQQQYAQADNMTDSLAALGCLANDAEPAAAKAALEEFYTRWQEDPLVVDKWFALQATVRRHGLTEIRQLMAHPAFTLRNPNRARALIFQFCLNNPSGMHQPDGSGYAFWAEQVLALDALNPEIAARLTRVLDNWSRYTPVLRRSMRAALERVQAHAGLSRNVAEIVSKALEFSA